jgi:carbonic anhydrase
MLADLTKGQQPHATILSCSDSRVPPDLVFDAGFGELFEIRVAGNFLGPSIMVTLQYAAANLKTPLFVIPGYGHCGALHAPLCKNRQAGRDRSSVKTEPFRPER